jgi:asparagine synthase (glutamine-hydrolysing)
MTYLPGDNLAKLDRASMAASLEMRLPLLDHRIIEFGYSLPAEYKINNGKSKWLLKQLLYRRIPEAIMERPKMGFTAPVERWLGGPLKEWAMDFMVDSSLARDGYLDAGEIDRKMDAFTTRGEGSGELWSLAVLHAWYQGLQA